VDERVLGLLEQHEDDLDELLALLEQLQDQGELRYFDAGDHRALLSVKEAIGAEIWQHRADNT
jgi:hypothetical protein